MQGQIVGKSEQRILVHAAIPVMVSLHGSGMIAIRRPVNWIAADILRIEDGILVEHWDVIQDEATGEQSKSGAPMFGKTFPKHK